MALAAAFVIAVLATPAGISGAVLLLPFQVSVLGTPSPAVTPTNLLYNVVATPGALYRYWRQGQTGGRLALVLIAGTLPGVVAGSVIRVELLPSPRVFDLVVEERFPERSGPPPVCSDQRWCYGRFLTVRRAPWPGPTPGAVAAGPRRVASAPRRWLAFPSVPGGGR